MSTPKNNSRPIKIGKKKAHKIKNILAKILANATTLQRDCNLLADQRRRLGKIASQVSELARLLGLQEGGGEEA